MSERASLLTGLEAEVGTVIYRAKRIVAERARLVHPDLPPLGLLVLALAGRDGPQRASAFVEVLGVDKASVSRHVQHLEALGLVDRLPDPVDGRATLVAVTKEGSRRLATVAEVRRAHLAASLEDFPTADLRALVELLGRYNALLEA